MEEIEKKKMYYEAHNFVIKKKRKQRKKDLIKVTTSIQVTNAFKKYTDWNQSIEIQESFYLMGLNRMNQIIFIKRVSLGGIDGTIVDYRIIFKLLISYLCSSFIVAHNHPSGNLKPSMSDIEITNKLKKNGKFLDIELLDHIILTENNFLSFADEGLIK